MLHIWTLLVTIWKIPKAVTKREKRFKTGLWMLFCSSFKVMTVCHQTDVWFLKTAVTEWHYHPPLYDDYFNTVIAWLANYNTHYFPCIFWIIAMFSFPKTKETFLVFLFGRKCWMVTFCFAPCPSKQYSFVLAIIEIPLI